MPYDTLSQRTLATRDEIEMRLLTVLWNHPLCRDVRLEVLGMPRNMQGTNWTVSLEKVPAEAIFETTDIVTEIQAAYDLAA